MKDRKILIDEITCDKTTYHLNYETSLEINEDENNYYVCYRSPDLNITILAFGETLKHAMEDFNSSFHFLVDTYLMEKDENLTKGAMRVKYSLKNMIKKIEVIH